MLTSVNQQLPGSTVLRNQRGEHPVANVVSERRIVNEAQCLYPAGRDFIP